MQFTEALKLRVGDLGRPRPHVAGSERIDCHAIVCHTHRILHDGDVCDNQLFRLRFHLVTNPQVGILSVPCSVDHAFQLISHVQLSLNTTHLKKTQLRIIK